MLLYFLGLINSSPWLKIHTKFTNCNVELDFLSLLRHYIKLPLGVQEMSMLIAAELGLVTIKMCK